MGNLGRVILGAALALALLTIGGVLFFGSLLGPREAQPLIELAWFLPTAQAFQVLAAFAIALLCLGRYRALGGAWVFWTGMPFLVAGIVGIFYLLAWPGLLGERGVIAQLPNTSSFLYDVNYSGIALLLAAVVARRPEGLRPSQVYAGYAMAALVAALAGLLPVLFEGALPAMLVGVAYTPFAIGWTGILMVALALAAASAYRRYRADQDAMLGYMAIFLVVMAFGILDATIGGKRYAFLWYVSRFVYISAYTALLFGFLQEGYQLFSRERDRAEERARLLSEVEQLAHVARRREAELDATIKSMAEGVAIYGPDGDLELTNPAFKRIAGFEVEQRLTMPERVGFLQTSTPEGRPIRPGEVPAARALRGEVVEGQSLVLHRPDGKAVWISASAAPIRTEDGKQIGAVATFFDDTEQHEMQQQAQRRAAELDAANKELEAFSYSVSHDLRAPLRQIDGFSRALLRDYDDKLDERGKKYLQFLCEGSRNMDRLVEALLGLSRVTRAELRRLPVSLSEIAEETATELRNAQPDRSVEINIAQGVVVEGDSQLLRIVLENLLGNAWKFTSRRPTAMIEFGWSEANGRTVYHVRDNGAGFDKTYVGRLFAPFQRLHSEEDYPGTGIGLATVQRIISRHGGRIWAEGEVDAGATFYFTLG